MAELPTAETANTVPLKAAWAAKGQHWRIPVDTSPPNKRNARAGRKYPHPAASSARRTKRSPQFEHAIDLALQGFAIFPLRPGTKEPLIKQWEQHATTDLRRIAQWWTRQPDANIAIACGPSNLLVIDLDTAKRPGGPAHGQQTLNTLAAGREVPRTFTVTSARGGRHLYYRQPDGATLRNTAGSERTGLGPLIDTRGHGGYVVAPGSTVAAGAYRIEHDAPVAPLPTWIAEELASHRAPAVANAQAVAPSHTRVPERRRSAYVGAALRWAADTVATAPEGTRNDTLNREAFRLGRLVGGKILNRDDAANTLRRAARKAGLAPREIENTITSGLAAGSARPRSIPNRTHPSQPDRPTKEDTMSATTAQTRQAAGSAITAPPNPATLYQHLSAPGSRAFQEALRTLWRLGPTAIGLPETTAQPVRAAWQQAGEQMAAVIHQYEADKATDKSKESHPDTSPAPQTVRAPHTTDPEPEPDEQIATDTDIDYNSDEIWTDVRASIERARQALPDWTEINTIDDVKVAIDEVLRYLAETPLWLRHPAGESVAVATGDTNLGTPARSTPAPAEQLTDAKSANADVPEQEPAKNLDQHLAAVETAYAKARSAGIATSDPEWAGIRAIHTAVHNLWDTVKAAAGTYWAELGADTRVHGLLTALAIRAARAIANLASAAADRLEQRTSPQPTSAAAAEPGLREAYINARNQIRAHAASHEWQRITALWGTVNTLARQTDDAGIRAVVARSADAISDFADTLSRKTTQHGNDGTSTDALRALARAAERHAAALRGTKLESEQWHGQTQSPGIDPNGTQPHSTPPQHQNADAQALRASARQVAQRAQARLGHASANATNAPLRPRNATTPNGHAPAMRPTQPTTPRDAATVKVR